MTWYAIRTLPGAQLPQREYQVESTELDANGKSRGKGYRIVPSLNPHVSAIERALNNNGFIHYMPVEKRHVRDRKKTGIWKGRRFPLLLGYVFVQDVEDWPRLADTPGVAGIVGSCGVPLPINIMDILMLRTMEAEAEAQFDREVEQREAMARRVSRKKASGMFPSGSRVAIKAGLAEGREATVMGTDRGGRLKALVDGMSMAGTISIPLDAVLLVA